MPEMELREDGILLFISLKTARNVPVDLMAQLQNCTEIREDIFSLDNE